MRKRNIAEQQGIPEKERRNLEEIGIDKEKWYRLWYDLYHNSIASVNPAHPSIIKHYCNIPQKYIAKFTNEAYVRAQRKNKK